MRFVRDCYALFLYYCLRLMPDRDTRNVYLSTFRFRTMYQWFSMFLGPRPEFSPRKSIATHTVSRLQDKKEFEKHTFLRIYTIEKTLLATHGLRNAPIARMLLPRRIRRCRAHDPHNREKREVELGIGMSVGPDNTVDPVIRQQRWVRLRTRLDPPDPDAEVERQKARQAVKN